MKKMYSLFRNGTHMTYQSEPGSKPIGVSEKTFQKILKSSTWEYTKTELGEVWINKGE